MESQSQSQRCPYEILGVERSCTAEEIRKAYRKLALKLHPDKVTLLKTEQVSEEEATARFQEVQRAYDLLSDPRERSWYDSHRSQILSSSSSSHPADFNINIWPYFSTCVYSGYGDSGKGFFKVYGDLFNKLFQQEIACADGQVAVAEAPLMGNLESPYAQVSAFYSYWLDFCTVKDFSWVDEYRACAGPNRKVRRLMEEENKKLRKKAKREYNEAVRQLAEFVRKRDKRVIEKQLQKKREQEEKLAQTNLRRKQLEKERLDKARRYEEQEWTRVVEEDRGEEEEDWYDHYQGNKPSPSANQEFYCIVCSKKFKSEKQWKNHEQSKKHKDKVLELRGAFVEEEDNLDDEIGEGVERIRAQVDELAIDKDNVHTQNLGDYNLDSEENDDSIENRATRDFCASNKTEEQERFGTGIVAYCDYLNDASDNSSCHSIVRDKNASDTELNSNTEEHEIDNNQMDDENSVLEAMLKTHRTKNKFYEEQHHVAETENHDINHTLNYNENAELPHSGKPTGFELRSSNLAKQDTDDGTENDVRGPLNPAQRQSSNKTAKEKRKQKQAAGNEKHPTSGIAEVRELKLEDKGSVQQQEGEPIFNRDRQEDALEGGNEEYLESSAKHSIDRKSATAITIDKNTSSKGKKQGKGKKVKGVAKFVGHTCETCGEDFDSRNQLFIHLSGTGHAMLKAR